MLRFLLVMQFHVSNPLSRRTNKTVNWPGTRISITSFFPQNLMETCNSVIGMKISFKGLDLKALLISAPLNFQWDV